MMSLPFADRNPTAGEVEKIRLLLSTYQDGTGMLAAENGRTLPGWRDFERSVALALTGMASESKALFDVVFARLDAPTAAPKYGLSCKMRSELNRVSRDGRVTIEVSNSAGKFWDHLASKQIYQSNYKDKPSEVGGALLELLETWHQAESATSGGRIDLDRSYYLVLLWDRTGVYQLFQFRLDMMDASAITWAFPSPRTTQGQEIAARRLVGSDSLGTRIEWYGESGGQLKFYPLVAEAVWQSSRFQLEPLPGNEHGILNKVAAYFPDQWIDACKDAP